VQIDRTLSIRSEILNISLVTSFRPAVIRPTSTRHKSAFVMHARSLNWIACADDGLLTATRGRLVIC